LTSVIIPDSVTTIELGAFLENPLTSITIGANVELGWIDNNSAYLPSFDPGFDYAYNNGGKQAGTYIRLITNNGIWTKL
jgi:hypothetical protein